MNAFIAKVNEFEDITNAQLKDLWRIKDVAFQPLNVTLDIQEYIPGLFDILKPKDHLPIIKIMSTFCYLQIESVNIKHEIEQKFFDPLIYFGESGLLYEEDLPPEETAGLMEIELARSLPLFGELFETVKKIVAITKNILLQMNGLYNAKYKPYIESVKKINYSEIFDNLGALLSNLHVIDLIINENTSFGDYW